MQKDDHYKILGLPDSVTDQDVAAAYRRLAKTCHPDLHPNDPNATDQFKRLTAAYEALKTRDKRATARASRASANGPIADAFRDIFGESFRGGAPAGPRRRKGEDVRRTLTITLGDAFRGGVFSLPGESGVCGDCGGSGRVSSPLESDCMDCGGSGGQEQVSGIMRVRVACSGCGGTGKSLKVSCSRCGGTGRRSSESLEIVLPPGCADGYEKRLAGFGAQGQGGALSGDMVVEVRIAPHPSLVRSGDDLLTQIQVPVWDAALGCEKTVTGVEGNSIKVAIPQGAQPGTKYRVSGRGMPKSSGGRGDLYIRLEVLVPKPEGRLRELFEKMRAAQI